VRVRIIKAMAGILDGQSLSVLLSNAIYDIDEHLAVQLIALGGAVEDVSEPHAIRRARRKKPRKARKKQSRKRR
jgi:hypothetical protein